MEFVNCLFCNHHCYKRYSTDAYNCSACSANYFVYFVSYEEKVYRFNIVLSKNLILYYHLFRSPECELMFGNKVIGKFPLDTFLIPLRALKNKINNIMAFI